MPFSAQSTMIWGGSTMEPSSHAALRVFLVFLLLALALLTGVAAAGAAPPQPVPPDAEYAPDAVMVQFKPGTPAAEMAAARAAVNGGKSQDFGLVPGLVHVNISASGMGVEQAVAVLSALPFVEYAEPDYIVHAVDTTPNDPSFGSLWGMTNIKAPAAWSTFTGSSSFVVADIDTGLDYTHQDIAANVWTNPGEIAGNGTDDDGNGYVDDVHGWNFVADSSDVADDSGHGTLVTGVAAARTNNGIGIAGV
jgi:subtilisin family serine protease